MPSTARYGSDSIPRRTRGRWVLVAVLLVCVAPLLAAYLVFEVWPPERRMNYGELISPLPLPEVSLTGLDGHRVHLKGFRGRWIMLHVDHAHCDSYCEKKLYHMRQVRLAQGREMERIGRVWLVVDDAAVAAPLVANYPGTHIARVSDSKLLVQFPVTRDVRDHIYLVDPLGNLMLRYPRDPDPGRMKKDLERLLKVSRVG